MKSIAIFYHCKLTGEGIPDEMFALGLMLHQMTVLKEVGLAEAAQEIHVGVNGGDGDSLTAASIAPDKAILHVHGPDARSEIPTMNVIERWILSHPEWYVLYHHTKGVTHPGNIAYDAWRDRMEVGCVRNWRQCIKDLDAGCDAVGCHWLTPEQFPGTITSPFFGGTFWWATTEYLRQLPPLPPSSWQNRYEAESWIGRRRPYPRVADYHPGFP
jgi:hypothetical protein